MEQRHVGAGRLPERDPAAAAAETVELVLGDDSPLPDRPGDVEALVRRLRGHILQLGVVVPPREPALVHAQQLGSRCVPEAHVASRVYLVKLAEATKELVSVAQTGCRVSGAEQPTVRVRAGRWRPQINLVRGVVFAAALVLVVVAASVPRT
ncbi:hypothetical protein ACFW17_07560 [Streptomyces sp. NPDC058961]|uniref:hypothetical protein n=1 Tax=Streptomyces sp. NPDC058961 TaxID=3346680 RepID=UPI0036AECCCF